MNWLLLSFIGWRERKSLVSCDKSSSSEKIYAVTVSGEPMRLVMNVAFWIT